MLKVEALNEANAELVLANSKLLDSASTAGSDQVLKQEIARMREKLYVLSFALYLSLSALFLLSLYF